MCKYTTNNLDSNTFLKKCWRNVRKWKYQTGSPHWINAIRKHSQPGKCIIRLELRMHYDGNCGAFIFLLIVSDLQWDVRIREFFMLIFWTTMWQKLHKKGSWTHTPAPKNLYTNGSHHRATKVVDFVLFCNSCYCLPSVIGLASSCSFCSS